MRLGASAVVGVNLTRFTLRLVKITKEGGRNTLSDFREYPLDPHADRKGPRFIYFLRSKLEEFCRANGRFHEIWAVMFNEQADVWKLHVPPVPEKQLHDAVFWTLKQEREFEEDEFLFDFEVQGEEMVQGSMRIAVLAYIAKRSEVDEMKELFKAANVPLHGLTITSIAFQNLFRSKWMADPKSTCAMIFIGYDWSRIDVFSDANLVLSRRIRSGVVNMVQGIVDHYNNRVEQEETPFASVDEDSPFITAPAPPSAEGNEQEDDDDYDNLQEGAFESETDSDAIFAGIENEDSSSSDSLIYMSEIEAARAELEKKKSPQTEQVMGLNQARRILRCALTDECLTPDEMGQELTEEEILDATDQSLDRLIKRIERTLEFYRINSGGSVIERIHLAGEFVTTPQIVSIFNRQLGIEVTPLDPLSPEDSRVGEIMESVPLQKRNNLLLPLSLALSTPEHTPNLLNTFQDRIFRQKERVSHYAIYSVFLVLLVLLAGFKGWQISQASELRSQLARINRELSVYSPRLTENMLMQQAIKLKNKKTQARQLSADFRPLAMISEVSRSLPHNVRLISMNLTLGAPHLVEAQKSMVIEGAVLGEQAMQEALLARYLFSLQNSPYFSDPIIQRQDEEDMTEYGEVLHFVVQCGVKE